MRSTGVYPAQSSGSTRPSHELDRRDRHLVGDDLPARVGRRQARVEEAALGGAEHRARVVEVGAVLRRRRVEVADQRVAAGLRVAVLALVEHEQVDVAAEAQHAEQLRAPVGREHRHRLEEGTVGVGDLLRREPRSAGMRLGLRAGVVVGDLVVVPVVNHGVRRLHLPQVLVGAVELVLVAVLLERAGLHDRVDAYGEAVAAVARERVLLVRVDVVAEVDHEVDVLLGQRRVGVVVAAV